MSAKEKRDGKSFLSRRYRLGWKWTLALFAALSVLILATDVYLQPGSLLTTAHNMLRRPMLGVLNLLPVMALLGILYAVLGNLFYAGALTSLVFNLMSLVNLIKVESRNDTLVPADFGLLKEALQATGEYRLNLHVPYIILIVLLAAVLFGLGIFFKTARPKLWGRMAIGTAWAGLFVLAMIFCYPSNELYDGFIASVPTIQHYNIPNVFDHLGFNYCFLRNFNLYAVDQPEGYDSGEAEAWAAAPVTDVEMRQQPNVIFVQCEAYSDIFNSDLFTYSEADHPMRAFYQVANSDQALAGHIVVSNYGAGTANTEFDVLTGMQTTMISATQSSAFRVVHKNTDSLARMLTRNGYSTYFMHPGEDWFYNRESVYAYLGISDQTFKDDFAAEDFKSYMIMDDTFMERLLTDLEARDNPMFALGVTIQNHQAYPYGKYTFDVEPVQTSADLSDEAIETLSVYGKGIRDSSDMLLELSKRLDESEKPTIVVFWGDHLPALGSNFSVYHELGLDIGYETTPEGTVNTYQTPFVLWVNRAYCEQNDFAAQIAALDLPENHRITSSYLGAMVYELLGLSGENAFFDFLNESRRQLPVICHGVYANADGSLTQAPSAGQMGILRKMRNWQYYRLTEERFVQFE